MNKITVKGGIPLNGKIAVSGSKNAALPIIFSCILTNGVNEIENLPDIGDVRVALKILSDFGARIEKCGEVTYIDTRNLCYHEPKRELVSSIRASTYLIGSCLSRFGICPILPFGGCNFSARPIDMHIDACIALGAELIDGTLLSKRLFGGRVQFKKPSVGATVNAILLAAGAEGESMIEGCAVEPHIDCLISFLNSSGAKISRKGSVIYISGRHLSGGKIRIIGDMIEAGSYLAAGLITDGCVTVDNCPSGDMTSVFANLRSLGAEIDIRGSSVSATLIKPSPFASIVAEPYPGFPTDLQPIFAPLLAKCLGGEIRDNVWQSRFGYLNSLDPFGIRYEVEGNHAVIYPSQIHSGTSTAPDLRGGFACILLALSAKGKSEIYSSDIILRGYEKLENKMRLLGADVQINHI